MSNKSAIVTSVGFLIVGLRVWMHSVSTVGWIDMSSPWIGALPMAVVLVVLAILAFLHGDTLDSLIFFGFGTLSWSHGTVAMGSGPASAAMGWDVIIWTLFFLSVYWGSRKASGTRVHFALVFAFSLLFGALHDWSGAHALGVIGGYLGLLAGLLALASSIKALACEEASAAAAN